MAGVVSALVARHDVEVLAEKIDDLSFALVAPLGADDGDVPRQVSYERAEGSTVVRLPSCPVSRWSLPGNRATG
jgi:hypothetical protein